MDITELNKKKEKFNIAKKNLKEYFIGIDAIIDKIFDNIEVWYLMPDLLERPLIVNLWGTTGVGKTDLVRRLAYELDFDEKYVEVQLDTGTDDSYNRYSIKNEIDMYNIKEEDSAMILLDEIQRFRSIDESGNMIQNSKYQDIWMLLSDGKFNSRDKRLADLEYLLFDLLYDQEVEEREQNEKGAQKKGNGKFKSGAWSASRFKNSLELETTVGEIMTWDYTKKINLIEEKIKDLITNRNIEFKRYKKLLIFISGNIDEAFKMAGNVSESSTDADIYHQYSKEVNIMTIKSALTAKFKPEQIARFGNIHIIYPTISKKSYIEIIKRKIENITKKTKDKHNITMSFTDSVINTIYRNGVFPIQGTRPLFSTISSIVENSLPYFVMVTKENNQDNIIIDFEDGQLIGFFFEGNDTQEFFKKKIILDIDNIKDDVDRNTYLNTCVHEIGHALLFAIEHKCPPLQIVGNSANYDSRGFMVSHEAFENKASMHSSVRIALAGTVAEEIVFGGSMRSSGNSSDINKATNIMSNIVRRNNMGKYVSKVTSVHEAVTAKYNYDLDGTNDIIEEMLKAERNQVKVMIEKNNELFIKLIDALVEKSELSREEFFEITKSYISDMELKTDMNMIVPKYENLYLHYKSKCVDEQFKLPLSYENKRRNS